MLAHYCLHKFNMLPSRFLELTKREKLFIIASIEIQHDEEEKAIKKATNKAKKKR